MPKAAALSVGCLLASGVNVEGELLPKFVQLLLQGPPAPSLPSHADLAGGSGTYQQQKQQRLAEWRMMRQARLLSMQEQLEELPHALETLRWGLLQQCSLLSAPAASGDAVSSTGARPALTTCFLCSVV